MLLPPVQTPQFCWASHISIWPIRAFVQLLTVFHHQKKKSINFSSMCNRWVSNINTIFHKPIKLGLLTFIQKKNIKNIRLCRKWAQICVHVPVFKSIWLLAKSSISNKWPISPISFSQFYGSKKASTVYPMKLPIWCCWPHKYHQKPVPHWCWSSSSLVH